MYLCGGVSFDEEKWIIDLQWQFYSLYGRTSAAVRKAEWRWQANNSTSIVNATRRQEMMIIWKVTSSFMRIVIRQTRVYSAVSWSWWLLLSVLYCSSFPWKMCEYKQLLRYHPSFIIINTWHVTRRMNEWMNEFSSNTIFVIYLFVVIGNSEHVHIAVMVNLITFLILTILMTITSIVAYRQITKLDVDFGYHNLLDELLLFVCIPAFFLNGIFSMIPAILLGSPVGITLTVFEVCLAYIQHL